MRFLTAPTGVAWALLVCTLGHAASAHAQTTALRKQVVAGGGRESASAGLALRGTAGQAVIGPVNAATREARQGYWYDGASGPTAVRAGGAPAATSLDQNIPNPFNPRTAIRFSLHEPARVTLTVYDVGGRLIKVIADRPFATGVHTVDFAAEGLASGVYFYRLRAGAHAFTKKMVLLK